MAREEHVDPGVAAAVEAGQQHGNYESRGCRVGRVGRKENRASLLGQEASPPENRGHRPVTRRRTKETKSACLPHPRSGCALSLAPMPPPA